MSPIRYRGHRRERQLSTTRLRESEAAGEPRAAFDIGSRRSHRPPRSMIDDPDPRSVRYVWPMPSAPKRH